MQQPDSTSSSVELHAAPLLTSSTSSTSFLTAPSITSPTAIPPTVQSPPTRFLTSHFPSSPDRDPFPPTRATSEDNLTGLSPPTFHATVDPPDASPPLSHLPLPPSSSSDRRPPPSPLHRIHYLNSNPSSRSANLSNLSAPPHPPSTASRHPTHTHPLSSPPSPRPHPPPSPLIPDPDESRVAMLLSAASRDHVDRVLSLLHAGLSPSASDYDRRTALHVAASDGALDVVKALIEEGADLNAKDRFGHTPLDEAVAYQHAAVAELLMYYQAQHGDLARLEAQLITAAAANDLNAARALLASGVPATCFDYDRRTPLHLAVSEGHLDMAKLLLEYKADPLAEDRWGSSPLSELQRRLTRTGQDPMRDVFSHLMPTGPTAPLLSRFGLFFGLWEVIFICLLGGFARYDSDADGGSDPSDDPSQRLNFATVYPLYQDVHVMIFIGFAYLMVTQPLSLPTHIHTQTHIQNAQARPPSHTSLTPRTPFCPSLSPLCPSPPRSSCASTGTPAWA